jgi:hypothetical protein
VKPLVFTTGANQQSNNSLDDAATNLLILRYLYIRLIRYDVRAIQSKGQFVCLFVCLFVLRSVCPPIPKSNLVQTRANPETV